MTDLEKQQAVAHELALIPQELRDEEAGLMQSRWFDYRNMLPAQATEAFAKAYDTVYRDYYAMVRDYRRVEEITPICTEIFKSAELIAIWKARQAADKIGCKYEFFLREAFKRAWERGNRYLPRPNQLYGDELVSDIAQEWKSVTGQVTPLAERSFFKNSSYVGHPDQDAYHAYLIEQVKNREHRHLLLSRLVFRERVLPLEVAGEHFGADVLSRAKVFAI